MFKLASVVHKQTREIEKRIVEKLLFSYRECAIRSIEDSKRRGEYDTSISSQKETVVEREALVLLKKELKNKGYKVSTKYIVEDRWHSNHYDLVIKWSTYTK